MRISSVIRLGSRVLRRLMVALAGILALFKLGSTAAMAASAAVSLAVYAWAFGFKFAVGFVMLLLVHEFGHVLASRIVGIGSTEPMFVPFIGAVISLRRQPVNAKMEANIAIGGPAAGTLSALGCLVVYLWTDSSLMLVLTLTACMLNLFNLIPLLPLDGGRIALAISPHIWLVGDIVLVILLVYTSNVFILLILLFSFVHLWMEDKDTGGINEDYYQLNIKQRLTVAWWYFGLLIVLGITTIYVVELLN